MDDLDLIFVFWLHLFFRASIRKFIKNYSLNGKTQLILPL